MKPPRDKAARSAYTEKLKDPKWQKLRLEVFERDEWTCQRCYDTESTLMVHHLYYQNGNEPWEYPIEAFSTLCNTCHATEHEQRFNCERLLLSEIKRKGFSYLDVHNFAVGFNEIKLRHLPEVVSMAYYFALRDADMQTFILDAYFKKLGTTPENPKK